MSTKYFIQEENHQVRCTLCPHNCRISEGERGICRVRKNEGGTLVAENYGLVSSLALDPIEKKPLYHFFPGSRILSAGTVGCNLRCKFCQNFEISQSGVDEHSGLRQFTPEEMVALALKEHNNIGIAYTYNEPLIWFEYVMDTARLAKESGLKNVMVTNGFASPEPLDELLPLIDA
ncbi:MAG: radical SAM protein, partial [Bacteroidetes bacterium]|nr:radical SAM protein [Bacteroidota bacterium]